MAGVYSQGIVYPMFILPNHTWNEGDDVTEILGITKYDEYAGEEPVGVSNSKKKYNKFQLFWYKIFGFPQRKKGGFTTLVSKTDETRVQNIPEVLEYKEPVVVTEKVDGCSMTATIETTFLSYKFNLYSRNLHLNKDNSHYWKAAEMYDLKDRMELMLEENGGKWLAIQGEVAGPGIQNNPYKLKDIEYEWLSKKIKTNGLIVSLLDFDGTGRAGAKHMWDNFSIPFIFITRGEFGLNNYKAKDFAELYELYNEKEIYSFSFVKTSSSPEFFKSPSSSL